MYFPNRHISPTFKSNALLYFNALLYSRVSKLIKNPPDKQTRKNLTIIQTNWLCQIHHLLKLQGIHWICCKFQEWLMHANFINCIKPCPVPCSTHFSSHNFPIQLHNFLSRMFWTPFLLQVPYISVHPIETTNNPSTWRSTNNHEPNRVPKRSLSYLKNISIY